MVSHDYIEKILEAIEHQPNVITFKVDKIRNGQHEKIQLFNKAHGDMNYTVRAGDTRIQKMLPNHLCVWRKDIISEAFPPNKKGEDLKWAARMEQHYQEHEQYHIDEVLYYYNFDQSTTETQHRR